MTVKNILNVAAACLTLAAAACSVVIIPPYVCGWLPEYPSLLDRVEYYWSPKAQFLKCNAVLHDIDAAKDAYELDHDRDACGASPTALLLCKPATRKALSPSRTCESDR